MKISHLFCLAGLIITAGCDGEGVVRLPATEVNVFHAASSIGTVSFHREAIQLAITEYGQGAVNNFESGQYDFTVRHNPVGTNELQEMLTFSETLSANLDYTFILVSVNGQPEVFTVTKDDDPPSTTTARMTIAHAFEGQGDIDVYVEPAGTVLSMALPRTTISFATDPDSFQAPAGLHNIFLTTANDPNDVLFESAPEGLGGGDDRFYVVSDPGNLGASDIMVSRVSVAATGRIGQIGQESRIRVINGIDDRLDRDIYLGDTMNPPLFPMQPFGVISPYVTTEVQLQSLITTPVGAPGTEEDSQDYFALPGRVATAIIAGDAGSDTVLTRVVTEDKRSIDGEAILSIVNGAGLFNTVDVYLELPGTDITQELAFVSLFAPDFTPRVRLVPDDYEITIVDPITEAVLAGPQLVTMDDGGVYGVLILNSAGGSTVDIQLFDDFIP